MKLRPSITDDDVEALLSDSLAPARRHVVEEHLATHPEQQARVNALRADQESLRALGAELLDAPLPERFLRLLFVETEKAEAADNSDEDFITSGQRHVYHRRLGA